MADELKKLREKMAATATEARSLLDQAGEEKDTTRAADLETQHDKAMADYDALRQQVSRLERMDAAEVALNAPDPRRPEGDNGESRGQEEAEELNYRDVFTRAIRFGAADLSTEERTLLMDRMAMVPSEGRAQTTGTDASGGYTVPEEFSGELDRAMAAWGPMWDADIVRELNTTNGRDLVWPTVDDTAKTGRIKVENAAVDDDNTDDVVFGNKTLNAYIYDTGMVRFPLELIQDGAFDIESLLNELFGERLGRTANTVLATGTGSSQPNGIVTASALGKTAAGAAAVTSDEIMDLFHSVDPAYRASPRCRWQFNDAVLAIIRKLKDGQGNYLWQMGDVRGGEPDMLLSKPYSVNQAMANMTTGNKTMIFGDHSKYVVRKVMGFQVLTLRERYAEKFQVGAVGFKRFDGELLNSAAVKHLIQA